MQSLGRARRIPLVILAVFAFAFVAHGSACAGTRKELGRADGARTPVVDYVAAGEAGCAPAMIISHGFGGDENALAKLASAMSGNGWRVIVMGHRESGRRQLRQALRGGGGLDAIDAAARKRPLHVARFLDLDAALSEATAQCQPSPLILAGHSMGAQTTMMEAGAVPLIGKMGKNRFDAYVALSPQGIGTAFEAGAWRSVNKPVLMITGTNDRTSEGDYVTRLAAFDGLPPGRKRLAVIPGAGHLSIGQIGNAKVTKIVNSLVMEFAEQIASKRWEASRIKGVTIREK